ncbi:histidine phosphatase family protein [Actinorhabdospora filicis]|uniref:Histidine phosphatase family protein n=1 Tax=Actinorhabdospora filicis TaxID=1785913 RepID=A0A9W6SMC7_9ACTN|nr:histidine phosphatase family protein [Actinorhabdospora filicis]GLZ78444.1 histidine phosphatase family protein [Actinorhabdospora filicis]
MHLVRHGEVDNPGKVIYERLPGFPLTPSGHRMAEAAAAALDGIDVAHLAASPLERTMQTAAPISATLRVPVTPDERLVEARHRLAGRRVDMSLRALANPAHWLALHNPFRPSWGEPYTEVRTRMLAAIDDARTVAAGRDAVLVSHQLPIWILRRHWQGGRLWHDPRRRQCALASITTLHFTGDELTDLTYRET